MTRPALDADEFARLAEPLAPERRLAVGVSGGPDSMALLCLAEDWCRRSSRSLTALTVDHGLRAESANEAGQVAAWAAARGVPHVILRWEGAKPRANLQAAAREARYRLMGDWCRAQGISALLLAHTKDDQAETVLARLARGSGVDGLSAMAPRRVLRGLALVRPLLSVQRAQLITTLAAFAQPYVEDPSNVDPRFLRARLRRARGALEDVGLTTSRLAATAQRMARARVALEADTAALLARFANIHAAGFCRLDGAQLKGAPAEIGLRALARILMAVGGADYPPRLERLERLYGRIEDGTLGRGATLAGCRIVPSGDRLLVTRELSAVNPEPLALTPDEPSFWDHRFQVRLAAVPDVGKAEVRALGPHGLDSLRKVLEGAPLALPALVRPTLPALFLDGALAAVPHLGLRSHRVRADIFAANFTGM